MSRLLLRSLFGVLVSVLIAIPCFWLPRIEAGDLASHTYNAWLASLVVKGNAPGLWLAPLKYNVMFDTGLSWLTSLAGFGLGERLAVCISVLIFFWGSFALVSTVGERPAYFLLPLLTVLAYGWTFHMGFFNFYLSIGIACVALAVLLHAKKWGYLFLVPFLPLIGFAHPLGLAWMLAVGGYMLAVKQLHPRWHILISLGALACAFFLQIYLDNNYLVSGWTGPVYDLSGTGQLMLALRYRLIAMMIALAFLAGLILQIWQRSRPEGQGMPKAGKTGKGWHRPQGQHQISRAWTDWFPWPFQLYAVSVLALVMLPDVIRFPEYSAPVNFIIPRFSIVTAIMACCCLNSLRPRKLFGLLTGAIAVAYFSFVYFDEGRIVRFERQAEALVHQLPEGARVFATISRFRGFRLYTHHVVDRACIGHCFNVGNYEASTNQFRVRADLGNRFVVTGPEDPIDIETGKYLVQQSDLPAWHIFQCGPTEDDLCMRPLQSGPLSQISSDQVLHARTLLP